MVTADGRVAGCAEGSASGAIAEFWTERKADGTFVNRYKVIGSA
jgi:hypothetical protein